MCKCITAVKLKKWNNTVNLYIAVIQYCVCFEVKVHVLFILISIASPLSRCKPTSNDKNEVQKKRKKSSILIWLNRIRCTICILPHSLACIERGESIDPAVYRKRLNECSEFWVNEYMFFSLSEEMKRNAIIVIEQHTHKQTHIICYAELRTVHSFMQKADDVICEMQRETYCTTKSFYTVRW